MQNQDVRRSAAAGATALALVLLPFGCGAPRGGPTNTYVGREGEPGLEERIGSHALQRDLEILVQNHERRDGRLVCQLELHNKRKADIAFEWTVDWFDGSGFKVDWNQGWRPQKIAGMGYEVVKITAPTPEAERWQMQVRRPNPVR